MGKGDGWIDGCIKNVYFSGLCTHAAWPLQSCAAVKLKTHSVRNSAVSFFLTLFRIRANATRAFTHQSCPRGTPVWDYTLQMGRYLKADASFPEAIGTVYNQICFNDDGSDNISNTCSSATKYYTVVWEMKFQIWQCTWWRCARGGCALLVRVMNQMAVSRTPAYVGTSELTLEATSECEVLRKGASAMLNRMWQAWNDSVWPWNRACTCARAERSSRCDTGVLQAHVWTLLWKSGYKQGDLLICLLLRVWHACVCALTCAHTRTQTHTQCPKQLCFLTGTEQSHLSLRGTGRVVAIRQINLREFHADSGGKARTHRCRLHFVSAWTVTVTLTFECSTLLIL